MQVSPDSTLLAPGKISDNVLLVVRVFGNNQCPPSKSGGSLKSRQSRGVPALGLSLLGRLLDRDYRIESHSPADIAD